MQIRRRLKTLPPVDVGYDIANGPYAFEVDR
jgi:hypothetical protein